jgi:mycoredoxin
MNTGLIVYTTQSCGDCVATKRALRERGIDYTEIGLEGDAAATALVQRLNDGRRSVPTLVHGATAASLSRFTLAKLDDFLATAGLR